MQHGHHSRLVIIPLHCGYSQAFSHRGVGSICTNLKKSKKKNIAVKKKVDNDRWTSLCVCVCQKLTSSLVLRVSPLASLIWTHGMESAWWGIGHMYFTTFDLYLTCTWSESNKKEWWAIHEMKKLHIKHFYFSCSIHPSFQHSFIIILKSLDSSKQVNTINFRGNLGQPNIRKSSNDRKAWALSTVGGVILIWREHALSHGKALAWNWPSACVAIVQVYHP